MKDKKRLEGKGYAVCPPVDSFRPLTASGFNYGVLYVALV